jgi:hypothetical protein
MNKFIVYTFIIFSVQSCGINLLTKPHLDTEEKLNRENQKGYEESVKNCKELYIRLYDRIVGQQSSVFTIMIGLHDSTEAINDVRYPPKPLYNGFYYELVEISRNSEPNLCALDNIVTKELAQEIIFKNLIYINIGQPNSNEDHVNFDSTFFREKIEPALKNQNPDNDWILEKPDVNWQEMPLEVCGCGMGNFTTIKLTRSELKLINDNYYKTGQEKKWKSKRAEKKMYRASSAEQKRNVESEKNCKKLYTTLYDRAFGKQPSGFVITVGQIDSEFADFYRYIDSLDLDTILEEEEEETNQVYLPKLSLLNNLYFELVEIHRDDSPEICKLNYIISNELAQEIIAKNAIFINLGKPNSNESKVNFDMTFFKMKIEPLLTHQNPNDDMIEIYPNNWTSESYEDCGCGMGDYTKKDLRKDLKYRKEH